VSLIVQQAQVAASHSANARVAAIGGAPTRKGMAPVAVQRPRAFRSTLIPLFRRDSATVPLRGCRLRTLSWWLSCRRSWRGVDWLSRVHTAPRSYTAQDGDNPRSRTATAMVSTPNGTVVRYVLMGFLFSAELRSELVCVCGTCSHD
jgi:hypothetical protein